MSSQRRPLSTAEIRVLGALIEKEITTPEYFPLSLNALVNACNQRSSRDPVLELSQRDVLAALDELEAMDLTASVHDGRVAKYEHRIRTVLQLRRDETALMCLLLLRGPQTPGELRSRADRMYAFDDLSAVNATLERLASRPEPETEPVAGGQPATGPLAVMLPRQPGAREARYAHLLGEPVEAGMQSRHGEAAPASVAGTESLVERMLRMEETVRALEARLARLEGGAPVDPEGRA